jgi:hypothetical protein
MLRLPAQGRVEQGGEGACIRDIEAQPRRENKLVNKGIRVGRNTMNMLSALPDRQISRNEELSRDERF